MKKVLSIALLMFIFLNGCGYTTRGFVSKEKTIYIPPVINKMDIASQTRKYSSYTTYPIFLDKRLTNLIRSRFNIDGHLKIAHSEPGALKLTCDILDYNKEAVRYSDSDDIQEQKLWLKVHIVLIDPSSKVLKQRDIEGAASFFLTGPNRKNEATAQQDLIDDTARRILEAVVEEW